MNKLALNLILIIPILGLIAGLSLGFTIPLFMIISLYLIRGNIKINFSKLKLEIIFFLLLFASCLWSISVISSLASFFKLFCLAITSYILIANNKALLSEIAVKKQKLSIAIIFAIILFYVEFFTNGALNRLFRTYIQNKENSEFYLHYLDRGCTLLALFAWLVIARLLQQKKNFAAFTLYIVIIITLGISDSLSAFVGFLIAGLVFILTRYSFLKNPKIIAFTLVGFALAFVFMIHTIKPYKVADDYDFLPISAKHRLFIWNFVIKKTSEKPFFGWGHESSKQINVSGSEMIDYKGHILSLLPNHPHNNLMQILLENGIIGFVLYLSMACKYLFQWNSLFCNKKTIETDNIRASGYAFFVTFFIISMISFNMWQSWWLCCFLWIGILLSLLAREEVEKKINKTNFIL